MSTPKKPRTKGAYCAACKGHRLHSVRVTKSPDGKVTRDLVCSACFGVTRIGISCPKCHDCRFQIVYTRHKSGGAVRVKSCRSCGHRIRTREFVEAG